MRTYPDGKSLHLIKSIYEKVEFMFTSILSKCKLRVKSKVSKASPIIHPASSAADLSVFVPQAIPSVSIDPDEETHDLTIIVDDPELNQINNQI